jgi:hypothetical protein
LPTASSSYCDKQTGQPVFRTLYADPCTALTVFRTLPPLARQFALRLVALGESVWLRYLVLSVLSVLQSSEMKGNSVIGTGHQ